MATPTKKRRPRVNPQVHTLPSPVGPGWINLVVGVSSSELYRSKAAARVDGAALARERKTEHVIHGASGRIVAKNSYGPDSPRRQG